MKRQSNKLFQFALLGICIGLIACNPAQQQSKQTETGTDTVTIWVDSSLKTVMGEHEKVFERSYTQPVLNMVYLDEAQIIRGLLDNKYNCVVMHRQLSEKESAFMEANEDFKPKEYIFAYDAFVFVTSNLNKDSILQMTQIRNYFTNQKVAGFQLAVENTNCQSIQFLKTKFDLSREQLNSIYAKNSLNELMDHLRTNPQTVGVIPFSYISELEAQSTIKLLENLKVMAVSYKDSTQTLKTIQPSQSSIADREYPLISPLVLVNGGMEKKSGTNFVNYIFKSKAQRLILRCGLCPAIFPGREVNIKTN